MPPPGPGGGGQGQPHAFAWPEGVVHFAGMKQQAKLPVPASVRPSSADEDAASDLMLQYRVASATAEQLASKVLVLQQQLSIQAGSLRSQRCYH